MQGGTIPEGVVKFTADPASGTPASASGRTPDVTSRFVSKSSSPPNGVRSTRPADHPRGQAGQDHVPSHRGPPPELDQDRVESRDEAIAFAKAIQRDHMHRPPPDGPFIDSGHNFLVTRSGLVLEGRHGSVAAIMDGVMVQSAHCPSQNTSRASSTSTRARKQ